MTAPVELERMVGRWLAAEASSANADRVLAAVLQNVATTGQDRFITQRLLGDRVGREPAVRRALALVLTALLVAGAVAAVGAWVDRQSVPEPTSFGNGAATYTHSGDIYTVEPGSQARLIVGRVGDSVDQGCAAFSADGSRLGHVEATAPWDTAASWSAVVSMVDAHGNPGRELTKRKLPGPLDECPVWSGDLGTLAWARPMSVGGDVVVGRSTAGQPTVVVPGQQALDGSGTSADLMWSEVTLSPDAGSIALVASSGRNLMRHEAWVVASASGARRLIVPANGDEILGGFAWSPDGAHLAYTTYDPARDAGGVHVADLQHRSGLLALDAAAGSLGRPAWSPDGNHLGYARGGRLVLRTLDGSSEILFPEITLDRRAYVGSVLWSPDGQRLLLAVSDASFVGRGVRFAILAVDANGLEAPAVLVPWTPGQPRDLAWQALAP
jgi:hypothetical protein